MKWIPLVALAAFTFSQSGSHAAPGRSFDEPTPRSKRQLPSLLSSESLSAPSAQDVGDPDSFGRSVIYLGLGNALQVVVNSDCASIDPAFTRCTPAAPQPAQTIFDERDIAIIRLPGKATKSFLCFSLNTNNVVTFRNDTAAAGQAFQGVISDVAIESEVLNEVIDPSTGEPFGTFTTDIANYTDEHPIAPGALERKRLAFSRGCNVGLISRRVLLEVGFTEAQAKEFFRKPITVRLGARGIVSYVNAMTYNSALRLYGD